MEQRYQVVIVGGGPVGAALAVDLGLRGISVGLVERYLTPQLIPKGQNLTQRTLEHFYFWGIADRLRAKRLLPPGYPIGTLTGYKDLTNEYWFAPPGRETVRGYHFQDNERLPQYLTEEVLRVRMAELPNVEARFGWTAEQIEQDESGVSVTIAETNGGGRETLSADYAVGCDGPRSMVRDQMGIELGGKSFDKRMVLNVFHSRELHEGLKRLPERTTYRVLHPDFKGYWQFFGRIDVGDGWFFHSPVPDDATLDDYDFLGHMERAAGFEFKADFEHMAFWDLRIGIANEYRKGRVFIAGDAAHTHPPYGGYGLNSGLDDAANLGWKLAAALKGWGGDVLLESYGEERRPIIVQTAEDTIAGGIEDDRAFLERYSPERDREQFEAEWTKLGNKVGSREMLYEPHYEGSAVIAGPAAGESGIHGGHSLEARAGHHLTPQPLSMGRDVYEELGSDLTLLAFGAEESTVGAFEQAAQSLGVPLKVVRDSYEGERTNYGKRLILVRPDQYVAWTSDVAPTDAASILRRAAGI